MTENNLTTFETQHLAPMINYAVLEKTLKEAKAAQANIKEQLLVAMQEQGIQRIDNDYLTITHVSDSTSTTIDLEKLKKEEPKLYLELLGDYPKESNRKATLRIKVK